MDIRYKQIKDWRNPESKHYKDPDKENVRIFHMLQDHDRQSAYVAWGFVVFLLVMLALVIAWVYTYVYVPLSGS